MLTTKGWPARCPRDWGERAGRAGHPAGCDECGAIGSANLARWAPDREMPTPYDFDASLASLGAMPIGYGSGADAEELKKNCFRFAD